MKDKIFSGKWGKCHCQGMTFDTKHEFIYYSFTTILVKTDIEGNIIGTVDNITGHLGCIDFNDEDGKVYASLEYKNDEIGRGILRSLGVPVESLEDAFYIAVFDVDKITRVGMDAETDGVMKAVYLKTVVDDYNGKAVNNGKTFDHVLGCSGIDGLAIGPDFGDKGGKNYLHVCYGVYANDERTDNDHQVILQYDLAELNSFAKVLKQKDVHKSGPNNPRNKYFLYTGNTTYGIQNLEYDAFTGDYLVCVYRGFKPQFPNWTNFVIDGSVAPKTETLKGVGITGKTLTLKTVGEVVNGISGFNKRVNGNVEFGTMGIYSFGDGTFYVVDPVWIERENLSVYATRYKLTTDGGWKFE